MRLSTEYEIYTKYSCTDIPIYQRRMVHDTTSSFRWMCPYEKMLE